MARRIFLSFDYGDANVVNLFRGQANNPDLEIDFYDNSLKFPINSQNAQYVKSQIRSKIQNVSVTVCLIGQNTYQSDWVNWELSASIEMKKGLSRSESNFMTTAQASEFLNMSVSTIKKFIYQGKIKTLKTPGGHHRFLKKDLMRMLYK